MAWTAANSTAVFVKYGGNRTRDRNATVAVIIYIDNDVRSLFFSLSQIYNVLSSVILCRDIRKRGHWRHI
jgi:hypothetical protein